MILIHIVATTTGCRIPSVVLPRHDNKIYFVLRVSGDETYLDIFQDFSFMASNDPEKLARKTYDLKLTTL